MSHIKILLGTLALEIGSRRFLVAPRGGKGRNFVFFLEPNPTGRDAGKFTPHVTLEDGMRRTLAAIC